MRKFLIAALVPVALFLGACDMNGPDHGTVYAKEYHQAYDTTDEIPQYTTSCTYNSFTKSNQCTQVLSYFLPVTTHHSECYELYFKDEQGDKGSACVAASDYSTIRIGDYWGTRP